MELKVRWKQLVNRVHRALQLHDRHCPACEQRIGWRDEICDHCGNACPWDIAVLGVVISVVLLIHVAGYLVFLF